MEIVIIDGQGGGIGRSVIEAMKKEIDNTKFSDFCIFVIQLAMYISTTNKDMAENEETKKTYRPEKKLQNKFSAVRKWDVGYIVGKTFRRNKEGHRHNQGYVLDYKRKSPIPHMRRGHFRLFHVGTGRQDSAIKWIDPVLLMVIQRTISRSFTEYDKQLL